MPHLIIGFWFFTPALAVVIVAAAGVRLAAWLAARSMSRGAIAELERRPADCAGGFAVVRGKLLVDGEGGEAPGSLRAVKCAATASWSSERRLGRKNGEHVEGARAVRLFIATSDGLFALDGPLVVVMGSRLIIDNQRAPLASTAKVRRFLSRTALFDGDEVVATGVLERDPSGAHDRADHYRAQGGRAVLVPEKDARMRLAAASAPRTTVSFAALFSSRAMWPAYVLALAAGGGVAADSLAAESYDCRMQGACSWLFHTTDDADCRAAPGACLVNGLCHAERGHCVARSDEDCRWSLNCVDSGRCRFRDGRCHEQRDSPTGDESACREWRRPSYVRAHEQVGVECAPSCAETGMCRVYGLCASTADGWCVATKDGCAASEACRRLGACSLWYGQCATDDLGSECASSEVCAEYGWCSWTRYENGEDRFHLLCFRGGYRSLYNP